MRKTCASSSADSKQPASLFSQRRAKYHVLRDGKPLRKQGGMPFTLPFSPDTMCWRKAALVELRKLGIEL